MVPAAVLVALLTLPFHPFWMDMEQARRGWLLCLAGALSLLRPASVLGPLHQADKWFLGLLGWTGLGTMLAVNHWEALYHLAHLTALFALFRWARNRDPTVWLRAILPTAIAVSAYGLLQRLGLQWPLHYAFATQPVSTLGNLNVASEFTALGAVAALMLLARGERVWPAITLVLGAAYLVVNGSLSGMIAASTALVWLLLGVRGSMDWKILAVSLALTGAGLGSALSGIGSPGAVEERPGAQSSASSTGDVRLEIWRSCAAMAAEAPLFGHGPGQFPVQYPRFRSQREIELSTEERQFESSPRTAHNDPLELLVEGGVPGLLLACAFVISASLPLCRRGQLAQLAPLLCFLLLSGVRSPLGNAPVAAWVMIHLGALLPGTPPHRRRRLRLWGPRIWGLLLLGAGIPVLVAQTHAARYLAARPQLHKPDPAHLERALRWTPFDPNLRELLVQESINPDPPDLAAADRHLEALEKLTPHSPFRLLLVVKTALLSRDLDRAEAALERLRELDPGNIEASTLRSTVHFLRGDHEAAIEAVYSNPHWRLREHLSEHMAQLESSAAERGDPETARFYACERAFLTALKALKQMAAAQTAVQGVVTCFGETGRLERDLRPWLLTALQFRGLDDTSGVEAMAAEAEKRGLELSDSQRSLFGSLLDRLRDSPGWQSILGG